MDFSAIKDLYIGSTPVQSAWLNGSKVWGRKPAVDEQSIRDAMILWYDLKKQGATNESMATTPTLIDHSGNGHDATCYNFAWAGMSGIGGYDAKLFTKTIEGTAGYVQLIDSYTIHISKISNPNHLQNGTYWDIGKLAFRVILNVSGIQEGQDLFICQYNNDWYGKVQLFEGRNDVTLDFTGTEVMGNLNYWYATFYTTTPGDFDVTIKLEPLYPNALVSDGVDDYCLVEGLPLLNKEDGYTVIAKRKWLTEDLTVESLIDKCFLSEMPDGGAPYAGAYAIELNLSNGCNAQSCGSRTIVNISEDDIIYQTSKSYCGQNIEISSNFVEGNGLFKLFRFGNGYRAPIALRSVLLFNRDLSTEEIEWVKNNLIEAEQ